MRKNIAWSVFLTWVSCVFFAPFQVYGQSATPLDTYNLVQSEIRVRVMREGALSGVSHNHIIVSKDVQGQLQLNPPLDFHFEFTLPLDKMGVDDPAERKKEGVGFEDELSESDVQSIRDNMLGEDVLDTKQFPFVKVKSEKITGTLPQLNAAFSLSLHGVEKKMSIPLKVMNENNQWTAEGTMTLKQTDFQIKPVSLLFGAIKVQDEIHIQFKILARKP